MVPGPVHFFSLFAISLFRYFCGILRWPLYLSPRNLLRRFSCKILSIKPHRGLSIPQVREVQGCAACGPRPSQELIERRISGSFPLFFRFGFCFTLYYFRSSTSLPLGIDYLVVHIPCCKEVRLVCSHLVILASTACEESPANSPFSFPTGAFVAPHCPTREHTIVLVLCVGLSGT